MARVVPVKFNRKDALSLWHDISLQNVRETGPDFSSRQMVILTTIYLESGPHTVRSLARKLNVTKAVVTRAIDRLEGLSFVRRCDDPKDKRSMIVERTAKGSNFLSRFADDICVHVKDTVNVA